MTAQLNWHNKILLLIQGSKFLVLYNRIKLAILTSDLLSFILWSISSKENTWRFITITIWLNLNSNNLLTKLSYDEWCDWASDQMCNYTFFKQGEANKFQCSGLQTKYTIIPFPNKFRQQSSSSVGIVNFLTIKQLLDSNLHVEHNNSEFLSCIWQSF